MTPFVELGLVPVPFISFWKIFCLPSSMTALDNKLSAYLWWKVYQDSCTLSIGKTS